MKAKSYLLGAQRADEGNDVVRDPLHRIRCLAARAAYASVLHEHHGGAWASRLVWMGVPRFRTPECVSGPVVQGAGEVLQADQWRCPLLPEAAVGTVDIANILELGTYGLMQIDVRSHGVSLKWHHLPALTG